MINVTYSETKKGIDHLLVKGHALAGEFGKDLVCAGVSAVIVGGANSLKVSNKSNIKIEDGLVEIKLNKDDVEANKKVLDVIIVQLKTIEKTYSKNIKIKRE